MIAIIDYGIGNLASVQNMFRKIGQQDVCVTSDAEVINKANKLLLPGVGSFDKGMSNLESSGLIPLLNQKVLKDKTPVLGICLGMQLLSLQSEEGTKKGLGWIDAETIRFSFPQELNLKIPHMGWNYVTVKRENPLVDINAKQRFYFVHSYHVKCNNPSNVLATSNFGGEFTCAVNKENIYGTQFHPEKSLRFGMSVLKNFANL